MSQPAKTEAQSMEKPRKPSKGEVAFDWLVYGGLAGVVTFLLTIPLAYVMKYKGGDAWLVKKLTEHGIKSDGIVGTAITATSLMHGGNVMVVPVYFAEKNREKIIDDLNKKLGDSTPISEIAHKPEQTVGSVLLSRVAAWSAVFAGFFSASLAFPKTFETFEHEFGARIARWVGRPQYRDLPDHLLPAKHILQAHIESVEQQGLKGKELKAALESAQTALKKVNSEIAKFETRSFKLGKLGALDVFATAAAASLLYLGTSFFGRQLNEKRKKPEPKTDSKVPAPSVPSASEDVSAGSGKFTARLAQQKEQALSQENVHAI